MAEPLLDTHGKEVPHGFEVLLTPRDVAAIMRVDPRTVANWAREGRLRCVRTMGGQRRFPEAAVRAALAGDWEKAANGGPEPTMFPAES